MIIGIDASRAALARHTGTETYAYHLIRTLIPLAAAHHIRLYFNKLPPIGLFPDAPHVQPVIIPFPRLWTHLRLAWELNRRPPDVFFTPAHVIPFTYRRCAVATIHDLGFYHFPQAHTNRALSYLRWSTRHNARAGRRIIADSKATQRDLVRFYHTPAVKIDVIYPGLDPSLTRERNENRITAVLQKYAITPPYLLFLSTLQPRKNVIRLIQAYADSGVYHQLVLAGKMGWLAQPILDEIDRVHKRLPNRIVTTGFVADEDKAPLLSGATALLYPSLYEGFGFPVLEAQVCGTAVLTANTSSLPEIAADSALLIDPTDTRAIARGIHQIVRDPLLRHELEQAGYENVGRFTWEKTAAEVLRVLETAVNKS